MAENGKSGRIRWWRWIGLSLLGLGIVLLGSHGIWVAVMASRMNQRIDALKQAGEPILRMDFSTPRANADENAATEIVAAAELIDLEADALAPLIRNDVELPLTDSQRQSLATLSELIRPSLAHLERARGKNRLELGIDYSTPVLQQQIPRSVVASRTMAALLGMLALYEHDQNSDGAAIQRLDDALDLRRAPNMYPSTIGHIVGSAIERMVCMQIVKIAPELRVSTSGPDASPDAVRRLIGRLLDDTQSNEALRFSFRGERMIVLDTVDLAIDAKANPYSPAMKPNAVTAWLLRPLYHRAGWQSIDAFNQALLAAEGASWPAILSNLPEIERWDRYSLVFMTPLHTPIRIHYEALTDRYLAAVALAVRWYAVDHEGSPPQALVELVPHYLPSVPVDRFSPNVAPLRYRLTAEGPIVHSVGRDGKDDGGSDDPNPLYVRGRIHTPSEWERMDRVIPLYRRPRTAPPADDDPAPAPPGL